jgi:hypothetical protein
MQKTKAEKKIRVYKLKKSFMGFDKDGEEEYLLPWIDYSISTQDFSLDHSFVDIEEMKISYDLELPSLIIDLKGRDGRAIISLNLDCVRKLVEFFKEVDA